MGCNGDGSGLTVVNVNTPQIDGQILIELAQDNLDHAFEILTIGDGARNRIEQADAGQLLFEPFFGSLFLGDFQFELPGSFLNAFFQAVVRGLQGGVA